ncbi:MULTISPECIES: hypothetical protein, partial [unclassified Caballeronia]|uniref:hypothetical protein n=1 Tax=unclassified Caballeronia TaxID=2646786 RepID=UPI0020289D68
SRALVQHEMASAQRYALPLGLQGKPSVCARSAIKMLVAKHAHSRLTGRPRSGLELFGAEPVWYVVR